MTRRSKAMKKVKNYEIFIKRPFIKTIIIMICIIADSMTLFSILETYITQGFVYQLLITIVISGALNISPVLLANFLSDHNDHSTIKKTQIYSMIAIFVILFSITFSLRWVSRADIYASNSTNLSLVNNEKNNEKKSISSTKCISSFVRC